MRLEVSTMNALKSAMNEFLPKHIDHDIPLPKTFQLGAGFLFEFLTWHINFSDIKYTNS